jgi:superfamily II DNA/RNA helicase
MVNLSRKEAIQLAENAGIVSLNNLQEEVLEASKGVTNLLILAATGSGKTLAYLIPNVLQLDEGKCALIIAPTRELVLQIEQVIRSLKTGLHTVVCYGGHSFQTEVDRLSQQPQLIIGTPGRLNDHLVKENLPVATIEYLVIDEYDKCLEMGFNDQIQTISEQLQELKKIALVSATELARLPQFITSSDFTTIKGQTEITGTLRMYGVSTTNTRRLNELHSVLLEQKGKSTMVFCNLRETTTEIHDYLDEKGFETTVYHGGMEQADRERAFIQFSNGTFHTLICTDIGARGLDIDDVETVVHFELPRDEASFIHRNGRTARMGKDGNAFLFLDGEQSHFSWLGNYKPEDWTPPIQKESYTTSPTVTIYFSGGKKDKLRKVDLVGALIQIAGLEKSEIGQLHVMDRTSFAAIPKKKYKGVLDRLRDQKIKGKKLRVALAKPANFHTE